MVVWEITLATAYFLGLKRTYRLALKMQRRIISPKHPKIRGFVYRRTRAVFDAAVTVHKKIQVRDIEAGRSFGNWILRWLDKMKPSAEIVPKHPSATNNKSTSKPFSGNFPKSDLRSRKQDSDRHLFVSSRNVLPKSFHPIDMMKPIKPDGASFPRRHLCSIGQTTYHGKFGHGVMRKDIMQWMHN